MAEYSREQRNQLSRAIANSELGSKQLKGFVDNRSNVYGRINTIKAFPNKKCSIQRFVIEEGNRKILSTTEYESGKIAEVEKGRSTYIEFFKDYKGYLVNEAKAIIGGRQRITSFDYLNKMIDGELNVNSDHKPTKDNSCNRKEKWRIHSEKYKMTITMLRDCLLKMNPLPPLIQRRFWENKSICEYYAGTDAVGAAIFLLSGQNLDKKAMYENEINSRLEEMELERLVCEEQASKEKPPKVPCLFEELKGASIIFSADRYYYAGDDCGKFANCCLKILHIPRGYYNGTDRCSESNKSKKSGKARITGYPYHFWNELIPPLQDDKGGGVATVETCAGKGGILRAVFDIRPTTEEGIENDIGILNQHGEEHKEYVKKVKEPERTAEKVNEPKRTTEKGVDISAPQNQESSCC